MNKAYIASIIGSIAFVLAIIFLGNHLYHQPYFPRYWSENQIREIVRDEISKDSAP